MRRFITAGLGLTLTVLLSGVLTGCCCGKPAPVAEAPIVNVPPQPQADIPPVPPAPTPPAPVEIPALPPTAPIKTYVAPPIQEPKAVPTEVAKAIQDLGTKYPGLFTFDSDRGLFRFNSDITFDSGSSTVKPQARAALTKLAEILNGDQAKDRQLTIIGYTDSVRVAKARTIRNLRALGKPANNQGLSEARAEAVAAVLGSGGVAKARMSTSGRGESDPVASNATASGRAQNRRVEIYLTPMGS